MTEDFSHLPNEEQLDAENMFLRMKLMLENNAFFCMGNDQDLQIPPGIENEFLKSIIEFEKQVGQGKRIKVFDKIERPSHFKPSNEIPDELINESWEALLQYLKQYSIIIETDNPNIETRELYRFTIEDLFQEEIEDFNMPGNIEYVFFYEEFHSDPIHENTRIAEKTIGAIISKEPVLSLYEFSGKGIRLNQQLLLINDELENMVNGFKKGYDSITLNSINETKHNLTEEGMSIAGSYDAILVKNDQSKMVSGTWQICFEEDQYGWHITAVDIEALQFDRDS